MVNSKSLKTNLPLLILLGIVIFYVIARSRPQPTGFTNLETWGWVDWKGRQRQITVHREVKTT